MVELYLLLFIRNWSQVFIDLSLIPKFHRGRLGHPSPSVQKQVQFQFYFL